MHRINARETDSDAIELSGCDLRVVTFARLFSTNPSVGKDISPSHDDLDAESSAPSALDSGKPAGAPGSPGASRAHTPATTSKGVPKSSSGTWKAVSKKAVKGRKINPDKSFLDQDPQLCVWHYLSQHGCTKQRGQCDRAHDCRCRLRRYTYSFCIALTISRRRPQTF